jgi:type IV pilus assembly protein PilC
MGKPQSLHVFIWQGLNSQGNSSSGSIEARNVTLARAQLKQQNIAVKRIRQQSLWQTRLSNRQIRTADIAAFSRQIATMIAAHTSARHRHKK